jgi:hypothetical protein
VNPKSGEGGGEGGEGGGGEGGEKCKSYTTTPKGLFQ